MMGEAKAHSPTLIIVIDKFPANARSMMFLNDSQKTLLFLLFVNKMYCFEVFFM